jgi:hypothetical protein
MLTGCVQVHLKFKLRHETLFLTVNIIDRFLTVQKVARQRLQVTDFILLMLLPSYKVAPLLSPATNRPCCILTAPLFRLGSWSASPR